MKHTSTTKYLCIIGLIFAIIAIVIIVFFIPDNAQRVETNARLYRANEEENFCQWITSDGNIWETDYYEDANYLSRYTITFNLRDKDTLIDDEIVSIKRG